MLADADILKNGALSPELKKNLLTSEWRFLCGLNLLIRAAELEDSKAAEEAYSLLSPVLFGLAMDAQESEVIKLSSRMMAMKGSKHIHMRNRTGTGTSVPLDIHQSRFVKIAE